MNLTRRQGELMDLLVAHPGWTNAQLAHAMRVSMSAVKQGLEGVFAAYGVDSRAEAILAHMSLAPHPARRPRVPDGQLELL